MKLRLTLLYSAILALMLAGSGVALYATLERSTLSTLQDTLEEQGRLARMPREFAMEGGPPGAFPPLGGGRQPGPPAGFQPPPAPFGAPAIYFQARDTTGAVVAQTENLRSADMTLPLDDAAFKRVLGGTPRTDVVSVDSGRLLVHSEPAIGGREPGGRPFGVVQVARSLTELDASLATLRTLLIVGTVLATGIAFGAGWFMAGFSLRPIERITRTAAAIGREHDFARRVRYDGPNDEVGRLARTFNTMLEALQGAHEATSHALEVQRRFVADASHELRTPLTTIRGNLRLLGLQPPLLPEDRAAVLSDLVEETERLTRLVHDLLALARADAGRPLRSEPVAVAPLIEDARRQATLLGPGRTVRSLGAPTEAAVRGDPDALKQVLLVLVDNAVKFTPPGGNIDLGAEIVGNEIALHIADTGPGIEADRQSQIFERFYRGDPARSGSGGVGLGLSIAKELVEGQGGTISVASQPGQGATFTIRLPRAATSTARASAPSEPGAVFTAPL